jgi:hypothetical protein
VCSSDLRIIAKTSRICGILITLMYLFVFIGGLSSKQNVDFLYILGILLVGISLVISGTFMIKLKQWARYLFIFQMCLIGAKGCWIITEWITKERVPCSQISFEDLISVSPVFVIFFLFPVGCIYYLTRPEVKEQFKQP